MQLLYHGLTLLGLVFCGIAIYLSLNAKSFLTQAETTTGKIVRLIKHGQPSGHEDDLTWSQIVEFKDLSGDIHSFETYASRALNVSWQPNQPAEPEFNIGDSVEVIYESNNPGKAKIRTWRQFWQTPVYFGLSGAAMLWSGLQHL